MFFNPMAYVLAGSAAVLLVGAVLFRKRVSLLISVERNRQISYRVDMVDCEKYPSGRSWFIGSHHVLFHSHHVALLQKSETQENSEKKAGAVSKRRRLIASGDDVLDITSAASSNPQFIEMRNLEQSPTNVSHVEEGGGIEIEGPIRPSSYYAMN
jgi:hypothetical protein